jgi:hypothetical protein
MLRLTFTLVQKPRKEWRPTGSRRCLIRRGSPIFASTDRPKAISIGPTRYRILRRPSPRRDVRLWHLADIDADDEHVCFWG